jgi:4-amino-4-deoxy-L-arabinose transferase-like glycosyltransferase
VTADADSRRYPTALLFALFFLTLFVLHLPLLRLPYFWDEAGYYVPAARDILLSGALIPYSTPSNAHPPLVLACLALVWKVVGYAPVITRTAMLAVTAFSLLGLFRLAERVANLEVAIASTVCTALYPVFFVQSSLALLDLAAAGLTFWGLLAYVEHRPWKMAMWFSLGVLSKETAIIAPLALFVWVVIEAKLVWGGAALERCEERSADSPRALEPQGPALDPGRRRTFLALLAPLLPLCLWYAYHWQHTGFVFGNPEFLRYNVSATLHPTRILLALGLRLWQLLAYMGMYLLTLAAIAALSLPPIKDNGPERRRIALQVQFAFLAVVLAYVVALAVIGGAVLARYMLPVVPLVIIILVSTLRRRVPYWRMVVGIVVLAFVISLFVNPGYGFSLEDNLAYRDYILLHEQAEAFLEAQYPMARVLTAWPADDEIRHPYLGYVTRPMRALLIEDFTAEQLSSAAKLRADFDIALVFSTKYQPPHPWLEGWHRWQQWKQEYFGYHRDLPPESAARILGGHLVYTDSRDGQWIGIVAFPGEVTLRR